MVDANREIKAMIMAALPYPPLPVETRRIDDENRLGEAVVCTSHDLIAQMIDSAASKNDPQANKERLARHRNVLRDFMADLVRNGVLDPPALYEVFCRRTADHIAAYFPRNAPTPEIKFMPLGYVSKGDKVHAHACEFVAAQGIVLEEKNPRCAQDYATLEFHDLLRVCRDRLVYEA